MTEKRFKSRCYEKQKNVVIYDKGDKLFDVSYRDFEDAYYLKMKLSPVIDKLNELSEENSKLQNQIDELEDDNEKYSKSLDKLEDYTKRFIPTKCLNEFKDCKTNRYYWLDHEGNLEGALELLNLMDCENEQLKQQKDKWKQQCIHFKEKLDGMDIAYLCDEWIYEELKGDVE